MLVGSELWFSWQQIAPVGLQWGKPCQHSSPYIFIGVSNQQPTQGLVVIYILSLSLSLQTVMLDPSTMCSQSPHLGSLHRVTFAGVFDSLNSDFVNMRFRFGSCLLHLTIFHPRLELPRCF